MTHPTLYLMLGYPGAGKTTTAKVIHELTGAIHLWADHIRRERFGEPTYTHEENLKLYEYLNSVAEQLVAAGQSVIFDTNFNFYKDRQKLRDIATKHGVATQVVWVTTPKEIAKKRATANAHSQDTRVLGNMPPERFDRMSSNLQPPHEDEDVIEVDGTRVTKGYIKDLLSQS
jgi:predicted kinase